MASGASWNGTGAVGTTLCFGTIVSMPVDIDIAKVANLARLALSADELEAYGEQLLGILEHAERVQALPTEGVEPTSHPLPMVNGFRPDEITPCLDRESFLDAAPDSCDGQFRVPRILGE
jgi:aspartyl-tRNA(Asn)/glutamyl-tRNA(Gln) amidotransferase subunit C